MLNRKQVTFPAKKLSGKASFSRLGFLPLSFTYLIYFLMLRFIFISFLFVAGFSGSISAQNFVEVSATSATIGTVNVAGKDFPGGVSRTGSIFIIRLSEKSGEQYKSYLGTPLAGKSFNGEQVFTNKDQNEFWYYVLGKSGYPSKKMLKVE